MDLFINIMSVLLPVYVVMGPKGNLTIMIKSKGNPKSLSFMEKVMCYIPIYNSYLIRSTLYGSSPKFLWLFNGLAVALFANLVIRMFFFENPIVLLVSTFAMLVVALILWIQEAWVVTEATLLFSEPKWIIFSVLVPPIGAWIVTPAVHRHFKANKSKLEGTFDGRAANSK